jgi:hypothetical protein
MDLNAHLRSVGNGTPQCSKRLGKMIRTDDPVRARVKIAALRQSDIGLVGPK